MWSWMQYSALSFEILAPLLFTFKPLRPIGFIWGFSFQMIVALTMRQLIYFSLDLLSFYVLFMDEKNLHRVRIAAKSLAARIAKPLQSLEKQLNEQSRPAVRRPKVS
jgi:hypothetical protein